jgi:membrane protease YdiL (CAAX protease family)
MHVAPVLPLWKIAGTFLAFLWVVSLSEEFFFNAVLRDWMEELTGHPGSALVLTSVVFGLVHLPFRGFPNWRWAMVAMVLGYFSGLARNRAGSIRASVVMHALVVTVWRAFFV